MRFKINLYRRKIPGTHFHQRLSRPQGHSAAGRIRSIEKSNDLIGIRTRDFPDCSIVPQPPCKLVYLINICLYLGIVLSITLKPTV
jgi:hypothetical protein